MSKRRPQWQARMNHIRAEHADGEGNWPAIDSMHTVAMSTAYNEEWVGIRRPDLTYQSPSRAELNIMAGDLNKTLREAEHPLVNIGSTTYSCDILRGVIMKLPSKTMIHLTTTMGYPLWGTFQFDDEPYEFMLAPRIDSMATEKFITLEVNE